MSDTYNPEFHVQWSADGNDITADPCAESTADSVRLRDYDFCVAEWTRGDDGLWTVTGTDAGPDAYESADLNGFRDPSAAVAAGRLWYLGRTLPAAVVPESTD